MIMKEMIDIWCDNLGKYIAVEAGSTLLEVAEKYCPEVTDPKTKKKYPVLAAYVDHKLKELTYRVNVTQKVQFLGYFDADGRRCYIRGLCFLLQKAVREQIPAGVLIMDHALPSGMFCKITEGPHGKLIPVSEEQIASLEARMHELVSLNIPFKKERVMADVARQIYLSQGQHYKAALLDSLGKYTCNMYDLDGTKDSFHGPLVVSTKELTRFALAPFADGFLIQPPLTNNFDELTPMQRQSKIAMVLKEYSSWCNIIDISGLGQLNAAILAGKARSIINISEALTSRKYAVIADDIKARGARIVFIAGPSSSGKTSSSLRIALQCRVLGLNPKVIELDNYFVDREHTPKDENGEYDFESLYAMDLKLLNEHLVALLAGEEVEIPKFDFKTGSRVAGGGTRMRLNEDDILIAEGIHALNPEMTPSVPQDKIYRVYASALTSLHIDENNNISTSDNRLLRRMIRDNRVRGISPEQTILRWHSVRRGENRNIFPFQENADAIFNSALIFELPMLKYYAVPLLQRIHPVSPAYPEAVRLLKFLGYIVALSPEEIATIPPTSIMREFIGGQSLTD